MAGNAPLCHCIVLSLLLPFGVSRFVGSFHLYALHYVYLPRLKKSLNNVRTAGCKMPLQLYTQGILTLQRSGLAAVELFDSVGDLYGVEEGLSTSGAEAVQVPIMRFQLLDDHYEQLRHATDPLRQSDNFGIDIP